MRLHLNDVAATDRVSFGTLLRGKRAAQDPALTQDALAKRMRVSRALVNLMEQDRRAPSRDFVSRAAEALNLPEPDAALLWKAAGFVMPSVPAGSMQVTTAADVERSLPSSDQNAILAYLARADVLSVIEGWRALAEADRALRAGRYDQARMVCAELAERHHATPSLRLFARRKLAEATRQLGQLDNAMEAIADEAVKDDLADDDTAPRAAFLRALLMAQRGEVEVRRGHYEQARNYFEASQQGYAALLESSSSETSMAIHLGLGTAFERLAKAALFLGNESQAEDYCTAAQLHLENATPCAQREEIMRKVVELRAWALARQGEFDKAIALHEEARDAADAAGDMQGVLKNCVYLGDDWRRRVEHVIEDVCRDEAGVYRPRSPQEAYAAAKEKQPDLVDWVRHARRAYEAAMRHMEMHAAPYMMGLCMRNLGIIARFEGKFATADALLHRAERHDSDMKLEGRLPAIYEARGDLYWGQGMHQLASTWYERALRALDALHSASDESPQSADERHETLVHARERLRVQGALTALEAHLPRLATQQVQERSRPDLPDTRWQAVTAELAHCITSAIHQGAGLLVADSDSDPQWIRELAAFEDVPGHRILAQDSLSAGWSVAIPHVLPEESLSEGELTEVRAAIEHRRARVNADAGAGYRDLATEATVLGGLATPDYYSRAQNVFAMMERSQGGYTLTLSRMPVPVAFTVKGNRVLAEVPASLFQESHQERQPALDRLAPSFAGPSTPGQAHRTALEQAPADAPASHAIRCFRFDDATIAETLRALFARLEDIAVEQGGGDALSVLRRHLSMQRVREANVGV